jgi:hypothetical protein
MTQESFIYSYEQDTHNLWRTNLVTEKLSCHNVPSYIFKPGCCWIELPGGSLLFTGGEDNSGNTAREIVRIDTLRDYAVSYRLPMLTPRQWHCAVHYDHHLYLLGGFNNDKFLADCERFVCAENRSQTLPPLPEACSYTSGVVHKGSLYVLGGYNGRVTLDFIQTMSLDRLTWEVMQFRLPQAALSIVCLQHDYQVYFIINRTLYSLQPLQALKSLSLDINSWGGPSYYSRGSVHCSYNYGAAVKLQASSLNIP